MYICSPKRFYNKRVRSYWDRIGTNGIECEIETETAPILHLTFPSQTFCHFPKSFSYLLQELLNLTASISFCNSYISPKTLLLAEDLNIKME